MPRFAACLDLLPRLLLALLVLHLAACSTMRPVDVGSAMRQGSPPAVFVGDRVRLETFGGERFEFRVTAIDATSLRGEPGTFAFENLRSLEVEDKSKNSEATAWVLGLLGVAGLVALIANADSVSVCGQGGCPEPGQ